MPRANYVTVEEDEAMDSACQFIEEEINWIPVVFIAIEEADVEEKRGRSIMNDEGSKQKKRPKDRNFPPVSRKTLPNKENKERAVTGDMGFGTLFAEGLYRNSTFSEKPRRHSNHHCHIHLTTRPRKLLIWRNTLRIYPVLLSQLGHNLRPSNYTFEGRLLHWIHQIR